ncbi:acetyltransferase [Sporosarcina koreensis]|uniref:Acetyltransferase n=1 Tax=Sporosarcina koreensis TaxID=334735 RepID=A0ABW0U3G6_9BACL
MNKPIIMIGNGGHASVLVETLIGQGREIKGYTAPEEDNDFFELLYIGMDDAITKYKPDEVELVLGIGTITISKKRKLVFEKFKAKGYLFTNVIHSTAIISPSTNIGQGVQIMAGAILQTNVSIADNTIINTGTIIDHDCMIGSHVHLAPGSTLSGGVRIGDGCHIGTGTSIIQGITIGEESIVGAGSVIVKNVGNKKKVYGVPAKEV